MLQGLDHSRCSCKDLAVWTDGRVYRVGKGPGQTGGTRDPRSSSQRGSRKPRRVGAQGAALQDKVAPAL